MKQFLSNLLKAHKDKLYHFGICFVVSILNPWLAVGLALGKEYGDSKARGNKWSWGDILADAIGVILGGLIGFLVKSNT